MSERLQKVKAMYERISSESTTRPIVADLGWAIGEIETLTAERDGLLQTIAVNEGDLDEKRDMLDLISSEGVPDATLWLAMKQQRDGAIAERDALREALAPSGETKGEYIGEVSQSCVNANDGYEEDITWTATKDIMKMILARAARNV